MSHKNAQKGTKREVKSGAGLAFWSAGLLPRIEALAALHTAKLSVTRHQPSTHNS